METQTRGTREHLQQMLARAWLEIDLDQLIANTQAVAAHVGGAERILATVKADAYGHGVVFSARALVAAGVGWLGVATVEEGIEIRQAGVETPILVLSPIVRDDVAVAAEYGLSIVLSSLDALAGMLSALGGERLGIHVGVDTGMGREGALPAEAPALLQRALALPGLRIEGVFTHLPAADEGTRGFTLAQIERFLRILDDAGLNDGSLLRHAANSAGILDFPESHLDLVRPGLLLYGLYPSPAVSRSIPVRPVLAFKSRVTNLKVLPAGHSASYGRRFRAQRPTRVATVAVGYADGFSRSLSCGQGSVLIGGRRMSVIGAVTMDQTLVEVPAGSTVDLGDVAVLIGSQGGEEIDAAEMAARRRTIPWEVLTGIGPRVPRVYSSGGRTMGARTLLGRFYFGDEDALRR
jgi:alanine racemase